MGFPIDLKGLGEPMRLTTAGNRRHGAFSAIAGTPKPFPTR